MDSPQAGPPAAPVNRTIEGALWAIGATGMMAVLSALGRHIASLGVEPMLIMFFRLVFAFICITPWVLIRGVGRLGTSQMKFYLFRSVITMGAMTSWFYAVAMLPIGDVTAISFLAPIFTTVGAVLFLGEIIRIRRWTATGVGFLGALIIIRPGIAEMTTGTWVALGSAVFMGVAALLIKQLTRRDDPTTIVFISHFVTIPIAAVPTLFLWHAPSAEAWPYMLATGPVAVLAQFMLTKSFSVSDASLVAIFDFAKLPWAVLIGWIVFGETSDVWTWVGAAVIFAAALYIVRRESALRRKA